MSAKYCKWCNREMSNEIERACCSDSCEKLWQELQWEKEKEDGEPETQEESES